MPRKTDLAVKANQRVDELGFNEAAARCRGKPAVGAGLGDRPARFNEAAARCRGKPAGVLQEAARHQASMRPRPDAAENAPHHGDGPGVLVEASMRPRPDAAENAAGGGRRPTASRCFNEAAARCRGKLAALAEMSHGRVRLQ